MENNNKRIFTAILVDDEIWALRGLKGIVDWNEFGFEIIGEYTDSSLALEAVREKKPDLLFTDIRMPGLDGMSLIETLKSEKADTQVVIVTAYKDFEIARQALKNEVSDYLIKPLDKEEVRPALEKLYSGLLKRDSVSFNILNLDLSDKKQLANPSVSRYLTEALNEGPSVLLVSDSSLPSQSFSKVPAAEIYVSAFAHAYLIRASLSEQINDYIKSSYGLSRPFAAREEFPQALSEATMSYEGAFTFSSNDQTARIEEYLFSNMGKKLSMDDVSNEFFLSKPYLFELFRNNTDTSAMNFLKHVRLSKASLLLRRKGATVRSVAEAVGFDDYSYFGKIFKEKYGLTPEQYILGK